MVKCTWASQNASWSSSTIFRQYALIHTCGLHTCQGQQFVCDEDGCVVLAAVEGFLAPLTKIFLHNFAIASDTVCLGRSAGFSVEKNVSPVEVAVGGGAVMVPGSRLPDARAHVCGVPAAAGRLSQPKVPLQGRLHLDVISDTQHPLPHHGRITRRLRSHNTKRLWIPKLLSRIPDQRRLRIIRRHV